MMPSPMQYPSDPAPDPIDASPLVAATRAVAVTSVLALIALGLA